jgi:hypothetical protein
MKQFTNLAKRKNTINEQQSGLLTEQNGIKQQIQNFEQLRGTITVSTK